MKKYLLLLVFALQMDTIFGQKVIAEDEKVIQYDTEWGNWVATPDNSNILFSAKLKWYDKQKKLYAWNVRHKVNRTPIAFEWKISNQVSTGAADYSASVGVNDGYYKSATFDSKDNANSMNGSGFAIYSSSKTILFYQVRNVCYVFDGRNPNCNSNTNLPKSKKLNSGTPPSNVTPTYATNPSQSQQVQQQSTTTLPQAANNNTQNQIDAINTIGSMASSAATSVVQKGLANLMQNAEIEAQVKQILAGRENQYPQAAEYFNLYLREKKRANRGVWIGTGIAGAGTVAAGIGALSGGDYDINESLVYTGAGAVVVGLIKVLVSIPVSKKGTEALQSAKRSLTFGTAISGVGISLKFKIIAFIDKILGYEKDIDTKSAFIVCNGAFCPTKR